VRPRQIRTSCLACVVTAAGKVIIQRTRALQISSGILKALTNELALAAGQLLNTTPIRCSAYVYCRDIKAADKTEPQAQIGYLRIFKWLWKSVHFWRLLAAALGGLSTSLRPKGLLRQRQPWPPRTRILRGRSSDVVSQCGRIFSCLDDIVLGGRATKPILS
jgi:hypothetical protein